MATPLPSRTDEASPMITAVTAVPCRSEVCSLAILALRERSALAHGAATLQTPSRPSVSTTSPPLPSAIVAAITVDGSLWFYDAATAAYVAPPMPSIGAVCSAATGVPGVDDPMLWIGLRNRKGLLVVRVTSSTARPAPDVGSTAARPATGGVAADVVDRIALPSGEHATAIQATRSRILCVTNDDCCHVWVASSRALSHSFKIRDGASLSIAAAGPVLWCSNARGVLCAYGYLEGECLHVNSPTLAAEPVTCMAYVGATEAVWCGCEDGAVLVFDAWSGEKLRSLIGVHRGQIQAVSCPRGADPLRGSDVVLTAGDDGTIKEWDARSYSSRRVWSPSKGYATCVELVGGPLLRETGLGVGEDLLWRAGTLGMLEVVHNNSSEPAPNSSDVLEAALVRSTVRPIHTSKVEAAPETPGTGVELAFLQDRLNELEADNLRLRRECQHDAPDAARLTEVDPEHANGKSPAAASPGLSKDEAARLRDQLADANERAEDYKEIAKETTRQLESAKAELLSHIEMHETDTLRLREQLEMALQATRSEQARRSAADATATALEAHVETLMETIDAQFEDALAKAMAREFHHAAAAASSTVDKQHQQQVVVAPGSGGFVRGALSPPAQRSTSDWKSPPLWTASELLAVEGLLTENRSLKVQLDLLERLVEGYLQQERVRQADDPEEQQRHIGALTACFLALRRELGEEHSGSIVLEALGPADRLGGREPQTELQAIEQLVAAMGRRLVAVPQTPIAGELFRYASP